MAPSDFPRNGLPEVALVGRSNVGKSSLLNQFVGIKGLAHVSKTPGRTQLINFYRVEGRFHLVDLPGYGFARAPLHVRRRWEDLVTGYLFDRDELALVLLLIDARREPMDVDLEVRDLLAQSETSYAVVATKSDKLSRAALSRQKRRLESAFGAAQGTLVIFYSAVTQQGRKELWNVIETYVRGARQLPRTK